MALRTLVAKLVADTGQFQRGMKKAESVLTGFAGKVAAIAGGVLSARFLSGAISQSVEFGDSLAKTADRLGLTTQNLAALRHAGEMAGVGMEGIDTALEQFVRRLGDAQNGTGDAVKTLKELGLSAKDLASQSPFQSLVQVSDAMQALPNQAAKAAVAFDLFGRSGVKLLNLLGQTGAGLKDAAKQTAAFGTALDRTTAAKFELLDDRFDELKATFQGLKLAIGTEFAAVVNLSIGNLVAWANEGNRAANFIKLSIQTMAEIGIQAAASFSAAWTIAFESVRAIAAQTLALGARAIGGLAGTAREFKNMLGVGASFLGFDGVAKSLISTQPGQTETTAGFLATDLENQVAVSIAKVTQAFDDLLSRDTANSFRARFDDMTQQFQRAAQAAAMLATSSMDLDEVNRNEKLKTADPQAFREISLSRTAIGGLNTQQSPQLVEAKKTNTQLKEATSYLRQMARASLIGTTARFGP